MVDLAQPRACLPVEGEWPVKGAWLVMRDTRAYRPIAGRDSVPVMVRRVRPVLELVAALERLPTQQDLPALVGAVRSEDERGGLDLQLSMDTLGGGIDLDGRSVRLQGRSSTYEVAELLSSSEWSEPEKTRVAGHRAHVRLRPRLTAARPYEQYLTLLRVAWALGKVGGLCGVINPLAGGVTPTVAVENLLSEDMVAQCRIRLPPRVFTTFSRIQTTGGVWCLTRGHEAFGVPNFAFWSTDPHLDWVMSAIWTLFEEAHDEGTVLEAGSLVRVGPAGMPCRLRSIDEVVPAWKPWLETPGGTLILMPDMPPG